MRIEENDPTEPQPSTEQHFNISVETPSVSIKKKSSEHRVRDVVNEINSKRQQLYENFTDQQL